MLDCLPHSQDVPMHRQANAVRIHADNSYSDHLTILVEACVVYVCISIECSLLTYTSICVQWNLRIKDTLGAELLSSFRRLSFGGRFEPICNLQPPQDLSTQIAYTKASEVDFYTDVLLKLKHSEAKSVDLSTIVSSDSLPCDPHPVIYEQITGPLVRSVTLHALKTEGAAGPSGIDAQGWRWRRLCFNIKIFQY